MAGIKGSRHSHMRELRVQGRPPIRVFYAFDPYRTAILLIAGHKTDSGRAPAGGGRRVCPEATGRGSAVMTTAELSGRHRGNARGLGPGAARGTTHPARGVHGMGDAHRLGSSPPAPPRPSSSTRRRPRAPPRRWPSARMPARGLLRGAPAPRDALDRRLPPWPAYRRRTPENRTGRVPAPPEGTGVVPLKMVGLQVPGIGPRRQHRARDRPLGPGRAGVEADQPGANPPDRRPPLAVTRHAADLDAVRRSRRRASRV